MRYMLSKDDIIYVITGRNDFKVSCTGGSLWLTKNDDIRDYILSDGDDMVIKNSGKIG
jgi:hypothetical protein